MKLGHFRGSIVTFRIIMSSYNSCSSNSDVLLIIITRKGEHEQEWFFYFISDWNPFNKLTSDFKPQLVSNSSPIVLLNETDVSRTEKVIAVISEKSSLSPSLLRELSLVKSAIRLLSSILGHFLNPFEAHSHTARVYHTSPETRLLNDHRGTGRKLYNEL